MAEASVRTTLRTRWPAVPPFAGPRLPSKPFKRDGDRERARGGARTGARTLRPVSRGPFEGLGEAGNVRGARVSRQRSRPPVIILRA